ncbi:hypothetical protein SUGI_0951800 [Cryptomeria japonica]|nr:hypothetical protein SUGI_0951800 [Cryptomeria japonica]
MASGDSETVVLLWENEIEKVKEKEKKTVKVEEIIEEHVGALGFAQAIHVFLVSLAWFFDSQHTLVTIFTDARPSFRCVGVQSQCSSSICEMDRRSWEWVGGKGASIISEWDLVCHDSFKAGLPASIFFIGSFLGSTVFGRLADSYLGRKRTLLLSCMLTAATGLLTAISPNFWIYALLRFANGFSRSGIGMSCLVLSTEVVGRKWRGQVGQYGFFFFTAGFLALPAMAYLTKSSWRDTYLLISIPPLVYSLAILPLISESPRWLAVRGRTKEALEILSNMAKLNGKTIPPEVVISGPDEKSQESGKSLWAVDWARRRMIVVMVVGFGIGFVYYGIQLNVENLNFDLYLSVAVNALMEIPAVFLGSLLLSCMDRRLLVACACVLAGTACMLCSVLGKKQGNWGQLIAESVGFMAVSTSFDVMYIYSVELFPTNVRNLAVSMLRQALMTGASLAPVLVMLGRVNAALSFVVFGVVGIGSGFLTLRLSETRNRPLYETLEQQEKEQNESLQLELQQSQFVIA